MTGFMASDFADGHGVLLGLFHGENTGRLVLAPEGGQ